MRLSIEDTPFDSSVKMLCICPYAVHRSTSLIAGLSKTACKVRPAAHHLMLPPSIHDKTCTFHRRRHCDGIAVVIKRHGAADGSHKILSARICRCSALVGTMEGDLFNSCTQVTLATGGLALHAYV